MFLTPGQKPGKWKNVLLSLQVKVKEGMQGPRGKKDITLKVQQAGLPEDVFVVSSSLLISPLTLPLPEPYAPVPFYFTTGNCSEIWSPWVRRYIWLVTPTSLDREISWWVALNKGMKFGCRNPVENGTLWKWITMSPF